MASESVSKSVVWQLVGKFALQGIAFFSMPIFTRFLTPSDYGYVSLYTSWLSIFSLLEGLQVAGSIGNARLEYGEDKLPQYLSSIMTVAFLSFVIILLLFIGFNNFFSDLLNISSHLIILVVIHSFFSFVINFEITRLDQLKKVEKSTLLSLFQTLFAILFSVFLVLTTKGNKAEAKIYGQAIPIILIGVVIFILIYVRGKSFWNSSYIKFCLSFTLPLIFHGLGHLIFNQSDRIMLQDIHGDETLGIYSVSFSLCSVLTIIYTALNTAWVPFYFDYKKVDDNVKIVLHTKRYIKFFTLITIGFLLLSYDVFKIMAPIEYYSGMSIIPIFVLSNFFSFMYLFPVNFEFFKKKTKIIPIATFSAAIINIFVNWLLIPRFGIIGAALGTLISHIFLYCFHEYIARKIGKIEYEYKNNFKIFLYPILIITSVCIIFYFSQDNFFFLRWFIAIISGVLILKDLWKNKSIF